jgi:hypothetical protein
MSDGNEGIQQTKIIAIERLSQKDRREAHRMKGLVRFTKDDRRRFIGPPSSATRE